MRSQPVCDTSPAGRAGRSFLTRTIAAVLLLTLLGLALAPATARAEENRILTVTKNAVYGAAAGLFLGGVLALVVGADHRADTLRWGVVVGTFSGFAYGFYEVTHGSKGEFSSLVRERREEALLTSVPPASWPAAAGSGRVVGRQQGPDLLLAAASGTERNPAASGRVSW